jgi:hypothetical protein
MEREKSKIIRRTDPVVNETKGYSDEIEDDYEDMEIKANTGSGTRISKLIVDYEDFRKEKFPHRPYIINPWLRQGKGGRRKKRAAPYLFVKLAFNPYASISGYVSHY